MQSFLKEPSKTATAVSSTECIPARRCCLRAPKVPETAVLPACYKKKKKRTFQSREHLPCNIKTIHQQENGCFEEKKKGTKSDKCPHKGQHCQLGPRVPRWILPCLSSLVPLACCPAGKSMTRKKRGTKKKISVRGPWVGKRKEKKIPHKRVETDQEQSRVKCERVQREQIYILINKSTICMVLEQVTVQGGRRWKISDANVRNRK